MLIAFLNQMWWQNAVSTYPRWEVNNIGNAIKLHSQVCNIGGRYRLGDHLEILLTSQVGTRQVLYFWVVKVEMIPFSMTYNVARSTQLGSKKLIVSYNKISGAPQCCYFYCDLEGLFFETI